MATTDYAADARSAYAGLLAAGGVVTVTRASTTAANFATDTLTATLASVTTAGAILPLDRDGAYALDALTRGRRVRVLLAAVDSAGAALALTPQAGDVVALGTTRVTLATAPALAPDGTTVVLFDCEGDQ